MESYPTVPIGLSKNNFFLAVYFELHYNATLGDFCFMFYPAGGFEERGVNVGLKKSYREV